MKDVVRVASGQGFWGDSLEAPRQQVEGGEVDYLMLDYLAEVTMSILQKQKERDASMGYARDFVGAIESVLPAITQRGVKVIANAGGVNPPACAAAIAAGSSFGLLWERGWGNRLASVAPSLAARPSCHCSVVSWHDTPGCCGGTGEASHAAPRLESLAT